MELPNSWSVIGLSDICKIETGKWDANHATDNGKYRFYTCAYDFFFCDTKRFSGECLILAGNGANVGEVFFYNGEFDAYQRTYVINEISVLPKYLYYHFLWNWKRLNSDKQYGSATNYIRIGNFTDYNVFVSPLQEQHRIVTKIEELFSELDKGIESLKTAQQQLKIYRQSLLKHAFSGKLTEQWRAENQDKIETADALLARIQIEREQRYQELLTNWEDNGRQGTKPKAPKVMPPLTDEELAELSELPDGWGWEKLIHFADLIGGVTKGKNLDGKEKISIPYLRVANVQDGYLNLNEIKYIDVEIQDREKYALNFGDVLYTEGGDKDKLGRGAVWKNQIDFCIHQNHIFRARIFDKLIDSEILSFYSQTENAKKYFFRHAKQTTNLASINLTVLANLPVVICSEYEQQQILLEIESRLSIVDQLENTITTALQQSEILRQSILKKAFSGQLVDQDPNDEPASILLERIKAEKAALINPITKKTKSGKKTV